MKPSVLVVAAVVAVAGCSQDPLQQVSRLSDVELAEDAQTAGALPDDAAVDGENALGNSVVATSDETPNAGLLGFFRRKADDAKVDVAADDVTAALREAQGLPPIEETEAPEATEVAENTDEPLEGVEPVEVAALGVEADVAEPEAAPAQKRTLFGAIFGGNSNGSGLQEDPVAAPEAEVAKVVEDTAPVAEPVEEVETAALEVEEPRRAGLFGGFLGGGGSSKSSASAAVSEVTKDETVPMGKMARLCGAPINKFAKEVAQHPETGRAKYKLYDSKPSSTGPRNWYVTGFDDGCARQFTASLAVFGSVEMHEQLRYGLPSKIQPYTAADAEYEKVKRKVCGVGKGTPCGSSLAKLDRMAVFLTIYPNYTGSSSWTNALLYDGDVAAIDIASR
ncbi:hypothetical protein SAMN04488045_0554 [Thalassococcus halodurans]|uniref:Uncharacterized protein n=1 Tax=Thalassococcus halodurans TaxID=373675 RepID=A0A1H5TB20_9RHOB|nr:hypothetical protein [Thalassococcus halodurans]SEF60013.1 hypothetical protein SAMN04488045_0554 [Thalassococcus halodurans]